MFDPSQMSQEELASIHKASMQKAVEHKIAELSNEGAARWQELSVKGDLDGQKKDALLKSEMTRLLNEVGVEAFMKTPASLWEQCIINGLAAGENPGELLETTFRSIITAYSHPETCHTTREAMTKLIALAREVLSKSAGRCDCEECRQMVQNGGARSTTLH